MATVTVIIPSYNRKHLLGETLLSVFSQTFCDKEIIVVDDGSTDGTRAFLKAFEGRIRYVHKTNGGEASARNFGILQAHTPYLAFLDSDDLWEPTFLETTTKILGRHSELGLISTSCAVFPKGTTRPRSGTHFLKGDLFHRLFSHNFITTSAVVAKRECFEKVGTFNEGLDQAADYDMWLRIAASYPIALLNRPLCQWREHSGNISQHHLQHRQRVLQVVEANFDPTRISHWSFRQRRSRLLVSLGRAYLQLGQVPEAKKYFQRAMKLTPYRVRPWQYLGMAYLRDKIS